MRKAVIGFSVLLVAACASRGAKAPVALPEVTIVQTGGVANAARSVTGPIPVRYAIRVANQAKETVTLKRIEMSSMGAGAYTLPSTSRPFDVAIPPDGYKDVEVFASAVVEQATIVGANGPVTLRLILHYNSAHGQFQDVVVQQVNDKLTGEIP
jgi:hypothetical protein